MAPKQKQKSLMAFGFAPPKKAAKDDSSDVDMADAPRAAPKKRIAKNSGPTSKVKARPKPKPKKAAPEPEPSDDETKNAGSDEEEAAQSDDDFRPAQDSDEEEEDADQVEDEAVSDADEGADDEEADDEGADDEDIVPEPAAKKAKGAKGVKKDRDIANLPPIHEITDIFSDLVRRAPALEAFAKHISGRKLRVATMCSGTESPLLALDLAKTYIKEHYDVELEVEHVFSCEIEPFKQGYIERNFMPALLFRDVCELGDDEAHTAFGSLCPVPGDVDLLVAGTSCVDFSNLNNQKQDIDGAGESARTFRGMMAWIQNHRPPIVVMENVCTAPWEEVKAYFEQKGYSATFKRFDTKHHYIPHTRVRGYLVAVDQKKSDIPAQWLQSVADLQRHASSPIDAFLLPSDDPRIYQSRQKLVQEAYNAPEKKSSSRTDWGRCESRHARARLEEKLGNKRPMTNWENGGTCKLPEYAWNDWGAAQVERVWDLMDITLLRMAKNNVDPSYKTHVWNLSQNVDRTTGSNAVGICPCLTPNMIAYITNRGGPLVGREALSLQGLPVDKLLLTRESEDQLADLAGNAMSSTVVGTCIIAALTRGMKLLKAGDATQSYEKQKDLVDEDDEDTAAQEVAKDLATRSEDHIVGDDNLVFRTLDLSPTQAIALPELLSLAERSRRLCVCEGRVDRTTSPILQCADCQTTICARCSRVGEHRDLTTLDFTSEPRLSPVEQARMLKASLPMCIRVSGVSADSLDSLRPQDGVGMTDEIWDKWRDAVLRATSSDIHFVEVKRQEIWSAVYASPGATLELLIQQGRPEWRLYAKAEPEELSQSEIRRVLSTAVGRQSCATDDLMSGRFEFALPNHREFTIRIVASGEKVPSWRNRLGLEDYKEDFVYSHLTISVSDEDRAFLDCDISGVYDLYDKCGTANGALHKRRSDDPAAPPLYMLYDPDRVFDKLDSFVFSFSKRRYEYGETRPIVCRVDPSWDLPRDENESEARCRLSCQWTPVASVGLKASIIPDAKFGTPAHALYDSLGENACSSATALLSCVIPLPSQSAVHWPEGDWHTVDKIHERSVFKQLAWIFERSRAEDVVFNQWHDVACGDAERCERCAPRTPAIRWVQAAKKKKMVAIEDASEAGDYERRLKRRPSPFVTQWKQDDNGTGQIRVAINLPSLLHRAQSRLPPTPLETSPVQLSWRIDTNYIPALTSRLPKFTLKSNKQDEEHKQPPHFKINLRKEQLRSLTWMIEQESADAKSFSEEEISEAILEPLRWRAEARAVREVKVLGGVLADAVGYGKTAIMLALIDCMKKKVNKEHEKAEDIPGKISISATYVTVPPHLIRQWESETKKFTGNTLNVMVLSSHASINSKTIEDYEDADLIIAASNLFKSDNYLDNIAAIAGCGSFPSSEGRYFDAHLSRSLDALKKKTEILKTEGSAALLASMRADQKRMHDEELAAAAANIIPSKRLKGKKLRDATEKVDTEAHKVDVEASSTVVSSAATSPAPSPSVSSSSSVTVEVVISRRPDLTGFKHIDDEDEEEAPSRVVGVRRAAKKAIVVSDDDSDAKPTKRPATKAKAKQTKKRARDSDDDFKMASEHDEPEETPEPDSEESEPPAKKRKGAAKPKASRKAASTSGSSTAASSDKEVDAPKKKGTKRKATAMEKPAKKKPNRTDTDPWKLGSPQVRKDWKQMKAPPLEMFHFARKVIDEYTYLDGKVLSLVTKLEAKRIWVLSGTPPVHNFAALKTISNFLNIHLGVDDVGEGNAKTTAELKRRARDQTAAENFHSFREVHSLEWHAHRHELGQLFLDQFVRQNVAEIDEIPWENKMRHVRLPAAEYACYLELEHYLLAVEMQVKKGRKSESDREKRLAKALGESQDAKEALLKRCSHFDLELKQINAITACDAIVQERERQRDLNVEELRQAVKVRANEERQIWKAIPQAPESLFHEWVRVMHTEGVEDKEATMIIRDILTDLDVGTRPRPAKDTGDKLPEKDKERIWEHREATHEVRKLVKELVGRLRALRFFTLVRDFQQEREEPMLISCRACGRKDVPKEEAALFSSCGHVGCYECLKQCAANEACVEAKDGCRAIARKINIVQAKVLGVDTARDGKGRHYGRKLEDVIKLIKSLAEKERVLLFVQFPDLTKKVSEALEHHKVPHLEIKGSATARSNALDKFQNKSNERVLLLNVRDESASGANLTCANHAIFLSPLHAPTRELYQAWETQAVGRVVRYGQSKPVQIHRFITSDTIDESIFKEQHADLAQEGKGIEDVTRAMEVD